MQASRDEIAQLQSLLDSSIEQAGAFLRSSMELDTKSLSAGQVIRHLQGLRTVALGTVTARGEPRVAPITAMFVEGHYIMPTVAKAARTRHLRQRPGVSLTDYAGNELAIIIHGTAEIIDPNHARFIDFDQRYQSLSGGEGPSFWGGGGPVYIRIEPAVVYAHSQHPDRYPDKNA